MAAAYDDRPARTLRIEALTRGSYHRHAALSKQPGEEAARWLATRTAARAAGSRGRAGRLRGGTATTCRGVRLRAVHLILRPVRDGIIARGDGADRGSRSRRAGSGPQATSLRLGTRGGRAPLGSRRGRLTSRVRHRRGLGGRHPFVRPVGGRAGRAGGGGVDDNRLVGSPGRRRAHRPPVLGGPRRRLSCDGRGQLRARRVAAAGAVRETCSCSDSGGCGDPDCSRQKPKNSPLSHHVLLFTIAPPGPSASLDRGGRRRDTAA
jgi:hypothetical protein